MKKLKYYLALVITLFCCPFTGQEVYAENTENPGVYIELLDIELNSIDNLENTDLYEYYYDEIIERYSWITPDIYDEFSEEEIDLAAGVIESETKDQSFGAKVNVANVIINRYKDNSETFPSSLDEIVTEKNQFTTPSAPTQLSILALKYAYAFEDTTDGALWFNSEGCNSWASRNREYLFTDEARHEFYK